MQKYSGFSQFINARPSIVTIGNFDGVHLGHQEILKRAKAKAHAKNLQSVVYTFRPHPRTILHPDRPIDLLLTYDEKIEVIQSLGFDVLIEEPFSRDFSTLDSKRFFSEILIGVLKAQAIIVGYDFGFGKDRQGSLDILRGLCRDSGVELEVVPALTLSEGAAISSSRIRQLLLSGDIEEANRLLGREFLYSGVVVHGDARGRMIGFPTANVRFEPKLILPYGVYAVKLEVGGECWEGVANLGVRPTVSSLGGVSLEVHILDRQVDLYEAKVKVKMISRMRAEKKFSGLQELKEQIQLDTEGVRHLFDMRSIKKV